MAISVLEDCLNESKGEIIVAGDFNINFSEESLKRSKLYNILNSFSLKSSLPSHYTSSTNNGTLIDSIFTNVKVQKSGRYISFTSYHDPLFIKFIS